MLKSDGFFLVLKNNHSKFQVGYGRAAYAIWLWVPLRGRLSCEKIENKLWLQEGKLVLRLHSVDFRKKPNYETPQFNNAR